MLMIIAMTFYVALLILPLIEAVQRGWFEYVPDFLEPFILLAYVSAWTIGFMFIFIQQ